MKGACGVDMAGSTDCSGIVGYWLSGRQSRVTELI